MDRSGTLARGKFLRITEQAVTDVLVQHVDPLLVERIKTLAKERGCAINEVLLRALRNGLGMSAADELSETVREPEELTQLSGHWDAQERGVFQEALHALARAPATQLAPESIRVDAAGRGAK
jgi:hypothetical protein